MLTALEIIAMRLPDATIPSGYLELAKKKIPCGVDVDSQDYQSLIALLSMHLYTADQARQAGASGSGIVASEKEGDLSVSYADISGAVSSDLASTPWGVEADAMIKAYAIPFLTRYSDVC